MIAVLLGILKFLGLALLILLGLALLVILLVLLVPVHYGAEGSFHGAVKGTARVSWLLRLVSCQVSYQEELTFQVRIFGFPLRLGEADSEAEPDRPVAEAGESESGGRSFEAGEPGPEGPFAEAGESESGGRFAEAAQPGPDEPPAKSAEPEEDTGEMLLEAQEVKPRRVERRKEKAGSAGAGKPDLSKKRFSIGALCDKLRKKAAKLGGKLLDLRSHADRIWEKLLRLKEKKDLILVFLRDEENKKAFSLAKRKGFALLRHVRPKKLEGRIRFGFDDPSTTGTVLMYAAPFYGLYARHLELIPDFEETGIEGDFRLSGRLRLGVLLGLGVQLFLSREIRRLPGKLKKLRRELG